MTKVISSKFVELMNTKKPLVVAFGGRGSGKTFHICAKLLFALTSPNYTKVIFCRKYKDHIRDTSYEFFKIVANQLGIFDWYTWNDSSMRITHKVTKNKAIAKGLDDPEKTKGIADPTIIWVDEINETNENDITSLMALLRTPEAEYLQFICSFNPVNLEHWLRKYFFKEDDAYALKDDFDGLCLHTTFQDNEFIDREAYGKRLIINSNGSQYKIDVDYYGKWGNLVADNLFIYAYEKIKHTPMELIKMDDKYPIHVSVDFNVNPMTAIVAQHDTHYRFIKIIDEFRLSNSDVYELCTKIKAKYDTRKIILTGDAAGWSRSVNTQGHKSSFDIMQSELKLNWAQMKVPKGKPKGYVSDKRNLANALLSRHKDFKISSACPFLIEDISSVQVDKTGHMDKNKDATKSHLLDCFCDYLYSMCKDAVKLM